MDADTAAFYRRHLATAGGVLIVQSFKDGEQQDVAVFSDFDKADAWSSTLEADSCLFVPYIINEPDYGNVPPVNQH